MAADINDLKNVYLIYGPQPLRLEQALARLKSRFSEVDLDFNMQTFRGESTRGEDVVAACNTMPFMSERRLVVVRDADKMQKGDLEALTAYARDPSKTTTLVLVATKVDKRTALYAAVDKLGGIGDYAAPKKSEFPSVVVEMFASKGRTVGRDAAEALVSAVGYDLARLSSEIDKVIAFAGDARTLSRDDIEDVLSSTASTSIYELLDAMGSRDARASLRHVAELLSQGATETYIHTMAVRRIRELITASAFAARGVRDPRQLGSALRRQDWQVRDFYRQAAKFGPGELAGALRHAAQADAHMKTSRDSRLVLERWLLSVCGA